MTRSYRSWLLALVVAAPLAVTGCGVEVISDDPAPTDLVTPTSGTESGATPEDDTSSIVTACPEGGLTVQRTGATMTVTGQCPLITIDAVGVELTAEDVGELVITGTGVEVSVTSVERITVTGSGVSVRWQTGTPIVDDQGVANQFGPEESGASQ